MLTSNEIAAARIVRTDFDYQCQDSVMKMDYFSPAPLSLVAHMVESREPAKKPDFPRGVPLPVRARDQDCEYQADGIESAVWSKSTNRFLQRCISERHIRDMSGWRLFK